MVSLPDRQISVAVLIILLVQVNGNELDQTVAWQLVSNKVFSMNSGASQNAESLTECGLKCMQSVDCQAFCYDVIWSVCTVKPDVVGITSSMSSTSMISCFASDGHPLSLGFSVYYGRFLKVSDGKETFASARQACEEEGAHLFYYKSITADRPALTDIVSHHGLTGSKFWVGADDIGTLGSYAWHDGTPLPSNADVWADKQPDGVSENCVEVHVTSTQSLLNDKECSASRYFVCEMDVSN